MALRLKNTSSIKKIFGLTGGFGAFANKEVLRNNPELGTMLAKGSRSQFKKRKFRLQNKVYKDNNFRTSHITQINHVNKKILDNKINTKSLEDKKSIVQTEVVNQEVLKDNYLSYKWRSSFKGRYYNVYLQPTLFGNYSITKSWGSIQSRLGNYKTMIFDSPKEVWLEIKKITKQRKYKGYEPIIQS